MLTNTDIIYYTIYIVCLIASFLKTNGIKGINLLRSVLVLGLINECYVELMQFMGKEENFSHFLYIPSEYCIFTLFYSLYVKNKYLKVVMTTSIPIYLVIALFLAFKFYAFKNYPSMIYNIGCFLSIIWITLIMFNIELIENIAITKIPVFWIFSGLLIFYSGVYFFNAGYSFLLLNNPEAAYETRQYINLGLNIIFYTILTYAFICSAKMKNYTYP